MDSIERFLNKYYILSIRQYYKDDIEPIKDGNLGLLKKNTLTGRITLLFSTDGFLGFCDCESDFWKLLKQEHYRPLNNLYFSKGDLPDVVTVYDIKNKSKRVVTIKDITVPEHLGTIRAALEYYPINI
mgnify:CR=1 FL=1